ncbi:MAG: sugar phosphate isomerase/epimerase [Bacteroidaceae bacterium]|nr:sugar phosphate isomerase/epimerase [Bacteroidaceae bacterium]
MKKCKLLQITVLSICLIWAVPELFAKKRSGIEADGLKKEIGLQLYSVREDMNRDVKATLDSVAAVGYTFVEAAGYSNGKFYGIDPIVFKNMVEASGMKLISSHTGQDVPDEETWDECMEWWDEAIVAHKAAGFEYIVQPWMSAVGYESLDGLKRFCDYFNVVGEKCKAAGIKFGYHNHSGEFRMIDGKVIYDYMLANTDADKVFFQIDVYWALAAGVDPTTYMEKYPGRFLLWHIKDVEEIGSSGKIDFEPIYDKAKIAGLQYAIVEQEAFGKGQTHFSSIARSLSFLRKAKYVKKSYCK